MDRRSERGDRIGVCASSFHASVVDVVEHLPDATFVIDMDKRVVAWNAACEALTGVPRAEMLGQCDYAYAIPFRGDRRPMLIDLLDGAEPSDGPGYYSLVQRRGQAIYAEGFAPRLRQGQGAHLQAMASPLYDGGGRRCGAIETLRDVTERQQADRRIEASERKYRELVELANSIILRWTPDGRVTFVNEFGLRFFGYADHEILGRHVVGTIVPERETAGRDLASLMREICANPEAFARSTNENMLRDGRRVWIEWTNRVVLDARGEVDHTLSVGIDVTDRRRAEEAVRELNASLERRVLERTVELAEARDRAEEADRTKSAFLATMSHELRTPLNSIIGFTGILLQGLAGPLNEEQRRQLGMVQRSGRHLLALISDVLDISKIEAGQIEVDCHPVALPELIETAVHRVSPLVERKGLRLRAEIGEGVGEIASDGRRVEQIVLNLLSNAVKFTEEGEVSVRADSLGDRVAIRVRDTGIGIREEDLPNLFRPFHQVDTGLNRQYDGTGLGLAISKRLAERLGGSIWVGSKWGEGTTFTVVLPVGPGEAP